MPRETIAWVERELDGAVVSSRRMTGGVASSVHRLRVTSRDATRDVVLRRWLRDDWGDPVAFVHDEVRVLTALEAADIGARTPRVLAVCATGDGAGGRPALVLDRLPGRVHLNPRDPKRWLRQMAAVLVRLHAASVDAPAYASWFEMEKWKPPSDTGRPDLWQQAREVMDHANPPFEPRFVHRDYQHFNMLWVRDRMSAVLDWASACQGPADIDLGHCRLNLAVLYSPEWAGDFLAMYEAEAGRTVEPWWDLQELMIYGDWWHRLIPTQVAGRRAVDAARMTERVEAVVEGVLRRL